MNYTFSSIRTSSVDSTLDPGLQCCCSVPAYPASYDTDTRPYVNSGALFWRYAFPATGSVSKRVNMHVMHRLLNH